MAAATAIELAKALHSAYGRRRAAGRKAKPTSYKRPGRALTLVRSAPAPAKTELHTVNAFDSQVSSVPTGTLVYLSGIAQGDNEYQRTGRSVQYYQLEFRGTFWHGATPDHDISRVMLIYDKSPTGLAPTLADLFDATGARPVLDPRNMDTQGRFTVLKDKEFTSAEQARPTHFKWLINMRRKKGVFSGATSAIASCEQGSIYLLLLGNQTVAASQMLLDYRSTLTFTG